MHRLSRQLDELIYGQQIRMIRGIVQPGLPRGLQHDLQLVALQLRLVDLLNDELGEVVDEHLAVSLSNGGGQLV